MSRGDTDQGHDQTKLLLQPCLSRLQRLSQPLADGAKAKKSKTKLFHMFPFAMMVSHHADSRVRSYACLSLMGEIPLSCHNPETRTSDIPGKHQARWLFISEPADEPTLLSR